MARIKVYQAPQAVAEHELGKSSPSRVTRRRTKSRVDHLNASESEAEDIEEIESIRASSPSLSSPVVKSKAKRINQKSNRTKASPGLADDASPEPTPQLAKDGRRKGGNKRKWTHEYCLTCTNYGRACGGRREGEQGCAVCREPNKEKGEKLRECLWAEPEAGITTYKEAREKHKKAQAEARQQKAKAQKRPTPVVDQTYVPPVTHLATPDPLGIVPHPAASGDSWPTLSRPLDLRPPSHSAGETRPPSINCYHSYLSPTIHQQLAEDEDTATVNTSQNARHQSHPDIPGVHPPQVINLSNVEESSEEQIRRASMPDPIHHFPAPRLPPGLAPLPESFAPYYDPRQRAYILPVYPHSNLLPPPAFTRDHAATYISPYDAHPSIPLSMTGQNPPRAVFPTELPPRNTGFNLPQPLKLRSQKAQPLDRSGAPCRKWSKSDSKVTTLSGYEFKSKGWKCGVNGDGTRLEPDDAVSSNAVFIEADPRKSVESSELSSIVDVGESVLVSPPNHERQIEVNGTASHDDHGAVLGRARHNGDESESESESDNRDNDDDDDGAQVFLNQLWKEKTNGVKRKRSPSPEAEVSRAAQFRAVNKEHGVSDDIEHSGSECKEKVVSVHAGGAVAKTASFDNASKFFLASESKAQSDGDRATRTSTSSSHYEDAAEDPVRAHGFAAVNLGSKRKGTTSLESKRKILADLQAGDVDMDEV